MKLVEYMPPFLKNVVEFNKIFDAEDVEIESMRYLIDSILREVIVKSARTYGLDRYEKIYGITNKAETIEARRMNILFKMNNKVPYTLKWLINTLNESIGKDNYKLEAKDYELHITINLVYTEAAEMLKTNLVKQIPANIMLDYKLETKANEFIGAVISSQDYINLNTIAFERKEDITIIQENNIGLVVSNMEYMNVDPNTDIILEDTILNADESIGSKVSRQDYIDLNITTEEKKENISINQNTNLGLQLASQDYIEIGGKD